MFLLGEPALQTASLFLSLYPSALTGSTKGRLFAAQKLLSVAQVKRLPEGRVFLSVLTPRDQVVE